MYSKKINMIGKMYSAEYTTFQRCSSYQITGIDITKTTKRRKNAITVSYITVALMLS
jgi:hypothetical protein